MSETRTKEKQVLDLARAAAILRLTDLTEKGIHPEHLRRLHQKGLLVRIGRGVYTLPEASVSGNFTLAEVTKKVPRGVICLLSALRFHEIGTQSPPDIWMLSQWQAFIRRSRLVATNLSLETVVKSIADFIIPASEAAAESKSFRQIWPKGGPWQAM